MYSAVWQMQLVIHFYRENVKLSHLLTTCRKSKAVREFKIEGFTDGKRLFVLPPNGFIFMFLLLLLFS